MLPEVELLQYIYKTTDMGCEGILSVLDHVESTDLKTVLSDQLAEYTQLRDETAMLLTHHNELPKGTGTMSKVSVDLMSAGKLMMDRSTSTIAEMSIQGNSMGVSKTIKHMHDYKGDDKETLRLLRKLLATEEANVESLKAFL